MGQPVVHFEVIGKDPDGLRTFFGELFDWEVSEPMGPTDYMGGTRMMGPDQVPGGPVIGLFSDPEGRVIGVVGGQA